MKALADASDRDLIEAARRGDRSAFAVLWARHSGAAFTVARSFTNLDADDVVSEAFAKVYAAIGKGGGPTGGFRPYLFATVRNVASSWGRTTRTVNVDDIETFADPVTTEDEALDALDRTTTVAAFTSLPSRWQEVLWYVEVEGMAPRNVGVLLGLKPNSVSALAVRAREGLRQAWIRQHLASNSTTPDCKRTIERLPAYTRGTLGPRPTRQVRDHLAECVTCVIAREEADDLSSRLALILLPLAAGVAGATAYLGTLHNGGGAATATATAGGSGVTAALLTVGVATAAAIGISAAFFLAPIGAPAEVTTIAAEDTTGAFASDSPDAAPPAISSQPHPSPSPTADPTTPPAIADPTSDEPTAAGSPAPALPDAVIPPSTPPAPHQAPESTPAPTTEPTPSPDPVSAAPTIGPQAGPTRVYPVVRGTAAPGATVVIDSTRAREAVADPTGRRSTWTTVTDSTGTWSTTLSGIRPGRSTVTATQARAGQRPSEPSRPATVTLDPPPTIALVDLIPGHWNRLEVTGTPDGTFRLFGGGWESGLQTLDGDGRWGVPLSASSHPGDVVVRYVEDARVGAPGRLAGPG